MGNVIITFLHMTTYWQFLLNAYLLHLQNFKFKKFKKIAENKSR